ncbi:hypothetical protein HBH61_124670 [Parastagonospora nodorum]|nr:hypothetical protein HBH61_124670 [Parastagonospora nodorum]
MRARLPVRSAIFKHRTGGLVVKWVTISESPLLYVFCGFLQMKWRSMTRCEERVCLKSVPCKTGWEIYRPSGGSHEY